VQREQVTPALVLRTRPYGESDRIVTLITEQHGKVSGIAKGAKNSRRRFAGTLEPFVHIRAVFRQRPATDLVFLVRCELLGTFRCFTRDLDLFAAGSYVLELTDRMVLGRESGRDIYRLVHEALTLLDAGAPCDPLLRAFELHMLAMSGYAPALDRCRGCGRTVDTTVLYLAAERGGLVCRLCAAAGEPLRAVAERTARALVGFAARPLGDLPTDVERDTLRDAAAVTEQLLAGVTAGPLRTRGFLTRARVDSPVGVR
jgi:DNA repair protein RecO (recombination protein O)